MSRRSCSSVAGFMVLAGALSQPGRSQQPGPPPVPVPFTEFVAALPQGSQLCGTATPDGAHGIVAEGASCAIVDLNVIGTNGQPTLRGYVDAPQVSPLALRYRLGPAQQHWLFVAGGTTGLWRVDLCSSLFTSSPQPCSVQPVLIARVGCESQFAWKRCVDVDVIEGHPLMGGDPLVVALFAASSDPVKRASITACADVQPAVDLGANELRVWRIGSNGTANPYGTVLLAAQGANPPGADEEIGTALALDPDDPRVVYVALGPGGVRKVDIATSSFSVTPVTLTSGSVPACGLPNFPNGDPGCPQGDPVLDIAVVRTPSQGPLLYAARRYGRVVEVSLATGAVAEHVFGLYYPTKLAAFASGNDVLIATGFNTLGVLPHKTTVVWTDMCIAVEVPDENYVGSIIPSSFRHEIRLLHRDASTPVAAFAAVTFPTALNTGWLNSLELLPAPSPALARIVLSDEGHGFDGWNVSLNVSVRRS